jgi:hypothetical protein
MCGTCCLFVVVLNVDRRAREKRFRGKGGRGHPMVASLREHDKNVHSFFAKLAHTVAFLLL